MDSKIYELLTELQTNESEIYLVKTQSSYRESIRERLMQKRLNLLVQLEYQLLQHPLSFRPGNERDNKVMTELFSDVSAQRRKYQKALFWLSENYLKDLFPFQVTEGKMLESGVMEAWNFLKLLYPFLIRRLTDQNPGEILLLSGIPPRLVPYDPVSFFPQMKEGDVLVRHSDSPYTGTFMTNYLAMLWQMLQQANSLSEAELDPLLIRLTSQGVLNFIESPFLDPGIGYPDSDSEAEEQPEKEEEEEDRIKWKIKWRRPSD
ncbi:MAG: hypothetical protein MI784_11520 [Cytophagales bacterium]|nr:hypothetical protein [Cytophagales bacterium]